MIELQVQDYCQNCDRFDAVVDRETLYLINGEEIHNTTIMCNYKNRCINLMKYLKEQAINNTEEEKQT